MQEAAFLQKNAEQWRAFEKMLKSQSTVSPDQLAESYVRVTDDLAYARTFYPKSKTTAYLNNLGAKVYLELYRNKKEKKNRVATFWRAELPDVIWAARRELFYSFIIFFTACIIGAFSAANDQGFLRLILGDGYVNMTLENIKQGDPMAVYKKMRATDMFVGITINNIFVSFYAFVMGVFLSFGTAWILAKNGIMLGAFQYFFFEQGLLRESALTIWIHGAIEISAIVIAGAAGLVIGNSILFPKTYTRGRSFRKGAKKGLKIVIGLIPLFIIAGFLEGFVTRHTEWPDIVRGGVIAVSFLFILSYFGLLPYLRNRNGFQHTFKNTQDFSVTQ